VYLLRDDGDYHYAVKIPEGAKIPTGGIFQVVEEIQGHALEDRIVTEFDDTEEEVTEVVGGKVEKRRRRKVIPVYMKQKRGRKAAKGKTFRKRK